jgi:uncharacterized surface protein with fasciclin (FAS1) repeats
MEVWSKSPSEKGWRFIFSVSIRGQKFEENIVNKRRIEMLTIKETSSSKKNAINVSNKIKVLFWVVIILTIGLIACTGSPQTTGQQKIGTPAAGKTVYDATKLSGILLPHLIDTALKASDLMTMNSVVTEKGIVLKVSSDNGKIVLNDKVNVVGEAIIACNGIIYIIDQTITIPDGNNATAAPVVQNTPVVQATPVSCQNGQTIADFLRGDPRFSDFVLALDTMGYMDMLDKDGSFTVFAPPNGVFEAPLLDANAEKITICHATGSAKNPYVEITIDMNGLNGHKKHAGDIIPAPSGGCPGKNK